jgi:hypothetical protein
MARAMQIPKYAVVAALLLLNLVPTAGAARNKNAPDRRDLRPRIDSYRGRISHNGNPHAIPQTNASADTTFLGFWDFDSGCDPQGWISSDRTEQPGVYFHVDDFAGLGGGDYGRLAPLEGNQSMWCGARPDAGDPVLCIYASLPGYGNDWEQSFCTAVCLNPTGPAIIDYQIAWDTEAGYDFVYVRYDDCDEDWQQIARYDGVGGAFESHFVADSIHGGNIRFQFHFDSDNLWSDADGLYETDGALIVDSLTVRDNSGILLPTELFEVEAVGANDAASGNWVSCNIPSFGDFAGLFPSVTLDQEDPCVSNLTCMWAFIKGSTQTGMCGQPPDRIVVPMVNSRDQYIHNEIWSPAIPVSGTGSIWELSFDVYRDLVLSDLVFYIWGVRSIDAAGCPGVWDGDGWVRYGSGRDWYRATFPLGPYIETGATHIQISLGARDMCPLWCGVYGTPSICRTHAPLFDNVEVYRVDAAGPQWSVRDIDLFQDNFSADGTITGTARADMAVDILLYSSPEVLPGDSAVVTVSDPESGLDFHVPGDTSSGAAVYMYCSIDGPHEAAAAAGDLVSDTRYHHVGTVSQNGRTWHQVQMDSTWTADGELVEDQYNVDLNDNFFVPGDTIWFFFGARSGPPSNQWTYFSFAISSSTGETDLFEEAAANPDECTILPAAGWSRGGEILYVDGMNFRGAQPFFDFAFEGLGLLDRVDRYDIRGPSSGVGNHPGSRVVDASQQLNGVYQRIIWNTGDLYTTFGDGSGSPDKSNDTGMLYEFLENLTGTGGVYLNGDDVADVLSSYYSTGATQLRNKYITFSLVSPAHDYSRYGFGYNLGVNPLVVGEPSGFFRDGGEPDTLVAYGGCPTPNDFDVIAAKGTASLEMSYHGNGTTGGAIVSDTTTNPLGNTVGFILSGFSFHYIRDARAQGVSARTIHMERILNWLGNPVGPATGAKQTPRYTNSLGQNYPNPFNPTTTIAYSIARPGPVSMRVYNVAGQLVRTLVDEVLSPDRVRPIAWSGRNDAGNTVSSGVYFYRLVTPDFTKTRKMVILK